MDTLQKITTELGKAFRPIESAFISFDTLKEFLTELGWDMSQLASFPIPIQNVFNSGKLLFDLLNDLDDIQTVDENAVKELIEAIKTLVESIDEISTGVDIDRSFLDLNFHQIFPRQILDYLIYNYLILHQPTIGNTLGVLGILKENYQVADTNRLGYYSKEVAFEELPQIFSNPFITFESAYKWGTDDFDSQTFFYFLENLLLTNKVHVSFYSAKESLFKTINESDEDFPEKRALDINLFQLQKGIIRYQTGLRLLHLEKLNSRKPGLALFPFFEGSMENTVFFNDFFGAKLKSDLNIDGGLVLSLRGEENPEVILGFQDEAGISSVDGNLMLSLLNQNSDGTPIVIIGKSDGSNLSYQSISLNSGFLISTDSTQEIIIEAEVKSGHLIIKGGESDGFLSSLLGDGIDANFDITLGWSNKKDVYFRGSAGLEISLPAHIDLGPIEIVGLIIGLMPKDDKIPVNIGASIKTNLGPIQAVVENMGIQANFSFPPNNSGNLGPLNLNLGFKPPNGVGLSIDVSAVKGGGYLSFDHDRGEYAGSLELIFSEWIALKAIGLINTKMPDGSKGFSMVIIITAEFGSGIQLGFGFTLLGVGGILGINRIVNIDPLKDGVRTGAIESVLFPQNVVANAPRIISDLKAFFPIQEGQFLIGPMAKIGYGTPTLASISLGVIIEFPDVAITILGVVKVVLPDEEADVLRLQVNFLGRIEPSNKLLWFYAELYDSRILTITIEGGMGLLVSWGNDSNFVFSVGGFHPRYNPPPLPFPSPPRLAISILNESVAKIRVEGYFAVTSNTVQFGARAELFFGFSALKVEGHISFDVLIQFSPFYFIFEFSAGLSVKVFGFGLFSISISGLLEGPSRWHIKGKAKWKITWFGPTIKINIDETWGQEKQTELPPIQIFPLIEREFELITNWEAVLPKSSSILVALRELDEPEAPTSQEAPETRPLILHPVGKLRISQRKMPLKLTLDKLGNQRPSDVNKLFVAASITGGSTLEIDEIEEKFARGEFQNLSKSDRLSSPDFESLQGGIELKTKGEELQTSMAIKRIIRYETIIIDSNFKRFVNKFYGIFVSALTVLTNLLFTHQLKGNTITKSTISATYQNQIQPNAQVIELPAHEYTVANVRDNTPIAETASFSSHAMAMDFMKTQIAENPSLAADYHVIPNTEVNPSKLAS